MESTPATATKAPALETPAEGPVGGLARLFAEGVALLAAALLTVAAFVFLVPEVNDYHLASKLKHDRLASLPSPKIAIAGGSNLAFGIDSDLIEKQTGQPVVNMGMDGFLGVHFILAEVEPYLKAGDLVIVSPEHDSYAIPIEGVAENQFAVVKSNPGAWAYLTEEQQAALIRSSLGIGQAKAFRLLKDALQSAQHAVLGIESQFQMAEHVGRFSGFNRQGDLTSHLDLTFPVPPIAELDLSKVDPAPVVKLFQDFNRRMKAKGVRVLFSYPPITEPYYAVNKAIIDRIHAELSADPEINAPSPPSAFVLPEAWFFDTVYHVVRPGREARTRQLASDIVRSYPPDARRAAVP